VAQIVIDESQGAAVRHVFALVCALCASLSAPAHGQDEIRPFRINVSAADMSDLRRRILATRWKKAEASPRSCSTMVTQAASRRPRSLQD
jgi:hypothetical protein